MRIDAPFFVFILTGALSLYTSSSFAIMPLRGINVSKIKLRKVKAKETEAPSEEFDSCNSESRRALSNNDVDLIGNNRLDDDSASRMKQKLVSEAKYPLKLPFLAASLVVGGKGLTDLLITLIKVGIGFKGASLNEEFFGLNVLAIDAGCIALGTWGGLWTWTNMKDKDD